MDLADQSIGEDRFRVLPVSSKTLQGTTVEPGSQVPSVDGIANLMTPFPPPLKSKLLVQMIPPKFVVPLIFVVAQGAHINIAVEALPNKLNVWLAVQAPLLGLGIPRIWSLLV
jgi:hypothetical protein